LRPSPCAFVKVSWFLWLLFQTCSDRRSFPFFFPTKCLSPMLQCVVCSNHLLDTLLAICEHVIQATAVLCPQIICTLSCMIVLMLSVSFCFSLHRNTVYPPRSWQNSFGNNFFYSRLILCSKRPSLFFSHCIAHISNNFTVKVHSTHHVLISALFNYKQPLR
jgi:hypothetical protein